MGVITLPANVETDRQNGIKANSVHVQGNFDALLTAVNNKLEKDGSILPTSDLPMNGYKITGMATPTLLGDAATKGYVDNNVCMLAGAQTITGNKDFTGTTTAVTQAATDNSTKIATTAFIINVLEALYPVTSVYIGTTQNTCPLAALIPNSTWTLVSANIMLIVNSTATVVGNGKTLGLSDGTTIQGIRSSNSALSGSGPFIIASDNNSAQIGTQVGVGSGSSWQGHALGVTTDSTKSGLIANITGNNLTVNVWQRTA